MRDKEISRKVYELSMLERSIRNIRSKIKRESIDMKRMERKIRFQKIISAGRIVEDAGLLDDYDPDVLYQILVENYQSIRRKDISKDVE